MKYTQNTRSRTFSDTQRVYKEIRPQLKRGDGYRYLDTIQGESQNDILLGKVLSWHDDNVGGDHIKFYKKIRELRSNIEGPLRAESKAMRYIDNIFVSVRPASL